MTEREQMAQAIQRALDYEKPSEGTFDLCVDAIAELRKTCGGCVWFSAGKNTFGTCSTLITRVPNDGSGFCHEWESK